MAILQGRSKINKQYQGAKEKSDSDSMTIIDLNERLKLLKAAKYYLITGQKICPLQNN